MESYLAHLVIFLGIYWILASSLDLALGYCGLFNIGHAAFYGIGAYTSALLSIHLQIPFLLSVFLGGILGALVASLLCVSVSRLHGDYLALGTLAFGVIVEGTLRNWTQLTGGSRGLVGIPTASIWGRPLASTLAYAGLVIIFAALVAFVLHRITNSQFGRIVQSIRSDEVAASALGTSVKEYKVVVLSLSAFFAGIAGGLYAHYLGSLDPGRFTITESFLIISMVIIGGITSLRGALLGTALFLLIPEILRLVELSSAKLAAIREIIFASSLLIVLIIRPQGIIGKRIFRGR
jgi:branched-chain amino acid transport system permease protein